MKFGKMRIISNGVWVIFMRLGRGPTTLAGHPGLEETTRLIQEHFF